MPTKLAISAVEESTYVVSITILDESGNEVTPNSMTWTLTDVLGTVINGRQNQPITPTASRVDIVLSGEDLSLPAGSGNTRILTIQGTYDSVLGTGLSLKDKAVFIIEDLEVVL